MQIDPGPVVRATGQGTGSLLTIAGNSGQLTPVTSGNCSPVVPAQALAAGAGSAVSLPVSIAAGCYWAAWYEGAAISTSSFKGSGQGNGNIQFTVAANLTGAARQFAVHLADKRVVVTQPPATCSYQVNGPLKIGAGGGLLTYTVSTQAACVWAAFSNASWVQSQTLGYVTGPGSVQYRAQPGSGRSGQIIIAGQALTLTQDSACAPSLSAASPNLPAAGSTASVTVTIPAGCGWTATSDSFWLKLTASASGSGTVRCRSAQTPIPEAREPELCRWATRSLNSPRPGRRLPAGSGAFGSGVKRGEFCRRNRTGQLFHAVRREPFEHNAHMGCGGFCEWKAANFARRGRRADRRA